MTGPTLPELQHHAARGDKGEEREDGSRAPEREDRMTRLAAAIALCTAKSEPSPPTMTAPAT